MKDPPPNILFAEGLLCGSTGCTEVLVHALHATGKVSEQPTSRLAWKITLGWGRLRLQIQVDTNPLVPVPCTTGMEGQWLLVQPIGRIVVTTGVSAAALHTGPGLNFPLGAADAQLF